MIKFQKRLLAFDAVLQFIFSNYNKTKATTTNMSVVQIALKKFKSIIVTKIP